MTGLFISLAAFLILSAFFSAAEVVFHSSNKTKIKNIAQNNSRKANTAAALFEKYDDITSAIAIGYIVAGASAAAAATVLFTSWLGAWGAAAAVLIISLLLLICRAISTGSVAEAPEKFAAFAAPIIKGCCWLLRPFIFIYGLCKTFIAKFVIINANRVITEEELLNIIEEAEQIGGINEHESELIQNAIEFNDLDAGDILTPRVAVIAVPKDIGWEEVGDVFRNTGFSRLPVYETSIDGIIGVVHLKDYCNARQDDMQVLNILKPVVFIAPSTRISKVLRLLQQAKSHIAVVIDEFGGTVGIITLEDILEELVGEIWDEHDSIIEDIIKIDEGIFRARGGTELEKLWELLDLTDMDESDSSTVGGWMIDNIGRIPIVGDGFESGGYSFSVSATDDRRVLEVMIEKLQPQVSSGDDGISED